MSVAFNQPDSPNGGNQGSDATTDSQPGSLGVFNYNHNATIPVGEILSFATLELGLVDLDYNPQPGENFADYFSLTVGGVPQDISGVSYPTGNGAFGTTTEQVVEFALTGLTEADFAGLVAVEFAAIAIPPGLDGNSVVMDFSRLTVESVPEPTSALLLGMAGFFALSRRQA